MNVAKNIVLFVDGTWNSEEAENQTNVRKLFDLTVYDEAPSMPQVSYYLPGVGTDIKGSIRGDPIGFYRSYPAVQKYAGNQAHALSRKFLGGAFGDGTAARIKEAYAFLCTEYDQERGDKVFLFGFSRGAFAARSLAGFIGEVGILLRDKLDCLETAYRLYESPSKTLRDALKPYLQELTGQSIEHPGDDPNTITVHFLGVWDTVGALGLPGRLSTFTAERTEHHQVEIPPNVMKARQALAVHEQRYTFEPMAYKKQAQYRDIKQVWFGGNHADVGGGYPDEESGLAGSAFQWMVQEAADTGLRIDADAMQEVNFGYRVLHNELKGIFSLWMPQARRDLTTAYRNVCSLSDDAFPLPTFADRPYLTDHQMSTYRQSIKDKFFEVDRYCLRLFILFRMLETNDRAGFDELSPRAQQWWKSVELSDIEDATASLESFFNQLESTCDVPAVGEALALRHHYHTSGITTFGYLHCFSRRANEMLESFVMPANAATILQFEHLSHRCGQIVQAIDVLKTLLKRSERPSFDSDVEDIRAICESAEKCVRNAYPTAFRAGISDVQPHSS